MFVHAKNDDFVKPHHSKKLYDVYPGDKTIKNIDGDHNSKRPKFFKDSAGIFFYNTLQVQYLKQISDDYAGIIYNGKKDEEENKKNQEFINNNINNNNNVNNNNLNNLNNNEEQNYNEENEEEMFQKNLRAFQVNF